MKFVARTEADKRQNYKRAITTFQTVKVACIRFHYIKVGNLNKVL